MKSKCVCGKGFHFFICIQLAAGLSLINGWARDMSGTNEPSLRFEEPKDIGGSIFADIDRKQLLFRFKRTSSRTGSILHVTRDFTTPEGKLAAREKVVYEGNALKSFEVQEFQSGTSGNVFVRFPSNRAGKIQLELSYTRSGARPEHAECTEPNSEATLVNDMVAPFFLSHWDELLHGARVKCRFIVLQRTETIGFTFSRESESNWEGRPVVLLKMAPSSPIVAKLVEPLVFTVEKAPPHRVLQYVGRTTPKVLVRDKWKELDAITVLDWPP